uniref:NADH-ubiquinone oxidoreductase chain 6 n=1 Tax=Polyphaga plancyi TaxID=1804147 RepID=A0A6M9ATU3_9NEOP|nr:NADH dehydrogenase subunit 6 [Polyphaga plancyi]QKK69174.1 NADH dehydrogenase subunit 6 [Polyphaga plancyi]
MQKMLIMMSITTSFMFMNMNHPLAMGLTLLVQTTIICVMSGMMTQTFWFSYILFLIFLGGMMVLFIYVTSLASNELFHLSTTMLLMLLMIITLMFLSINLPLNNMDMMNYNFLMENDIIPSLMKLYNKPNNMITILMASYLFLTLITVVKITNISKGPLRPMN